MSLFQLRTYAEEFESAAEGHPAPAGPIDDSVALVTEDIEEQTRDFVLKRLGQALKGHPFAEFVAHLLQTIGYHTRIAPPGPVSGVDIVAHKDELGFEPPIVKVQVKSGDGSVGEPTVSALSGKVATGEYGLLVSLGDFTPQASVFARSKSNLRLISGADLVDLVFQYYEQFDSRYKSIVPLKRVHIPEALEED
jgi:restriction system protein